MKALSLLNVSTKPKYWLLALGQSVLAAGDVLRSGIIGALPWIYEKEHAACARKISGFEPPYAFLFPEHSEIGMENSRLTRRSQSMASRRKDKAEFEHMPVVEDLAA